MKHVTGLLALLIALGATGQQTMQVSLKQAQDFAIEHAYSVQNNTLEVQKAQKLYLENVGRGLPQVSASGNYTYNIERQSFIAELQPGQLGLLQIGAPYTALGTLNASQLIFDGSYIVAVLASQVLRDNAEGKLEKSRIDIRDQVARAYHLVLVSRKTREIIDEDLKFLNQNLTEVTKLFEAGFVEEQDRDQLELLVSNLLNNKDFIEKQEELALMLLKIQMGVSLETDVQLSDNVETLMLFTQEGTALLSDTFRVEENIDYRILETQVRGQTLNLKNENMQYLPKLSAFYNLNYNVNGSNWNVFQGEQGKDRLDVRWQALGLSLSIPILTGGTRAARVSQAKIGLQQVEVAQKQLQDNLQLQYAQAKAEYEYALNSYATQRRNAELAKKIRDRILRKYQEGLASSLDLTQAENQYQTALREALNAANNALDKKVNLEKVLGKYND